MRLLERGYTIRATVRDRGWFIIVGLIVYASQTELFHGTDFVCIRETVILTVMVFIIFYLYR